MKYPSGAWVLMGVLLCNPSLRSAEHSLLPQEAVVVLRNGRVLQGQILRDGDRYVVRLGKGGEIRLSADRIDYWCPSLEATYERKRSSIDETSPSQQLELAHWCMNLGLTAQAQLHISTARSIDPHHPRLMGLQRRLDVARLQPSRPSSGATHHQKLPQVSKEELDQFARQLPSVTVEQFTSDVQPILVNRCATSHCHGPSAASTFRLLRPQYGRPLPRRLTQRNLFAVLQWIDRDHPQRSPLLEKAQDVHGGVPRPVLGKDNARQLEQFIAWTKMVARPQVDRSPESIVPASISLRQADAVDAALPSGPTTPLQRPTGASAPAPNLTRPPGSDHAFRPLDPFDPEIFNRQFFKARSGSSARP